MRSISTPNYPARFLAPLRPDSLREVPLCLVAALLLGVATTESHAAYVVDFQQDGSNVIATGSGTLDLSALTFRTSLPNFAAVYPAAGLALVGPTTSTYTDEYSGVSFSGPADFGSGIDDIAATSGSGDLVGVAYPIEVILVPQGYVSGAALSDTSTWSGQSLNSLGITPGTYSWTWGSGATADSFTLTTSVVPEPASLSLIGLAACGLGFRRRWRHIA